MKPIDIDRLSMGVIQQPRHQENVKANQDMAQSVPAGRKENDSLLRLMSLVFISEDRSPHAERLGQIKADIDSDRYQIDFEALANNILVSEYEL